MSSRSTEGLAAQPLAQVVKVVGLDLERHELLCCGTHLRGTRRVDPTVSGVMDIEIWHDGRAQALVGGHFLMEPMPKYSGGAYLPRRFEATAAPPVKESTNPWRHG